MTTWNALIRKHHFISLLFIFYFIFPPLFLTKSLPDTMAQFTLDENEDEEGVAGTKELPEYACR